MQYSKQLRHVPRSACPSPLTQPHLIKLVLQYAAQAGVLAHLLVRVGVEEPDDPCHQPGGGMIHEPVAYRGHVSTFMSIQNPCAFSQACKRQFGLLHGSSEGRHMCSPLCYHHIQRPEPVFLPPCEHPQCDGSHEDREDQQSQGLIHQGVIFGPFLVDRCL